MLFTVGNFKSITPMAKVALIGAASVLMMLSGCQAGLNDTTTNDVVVKEKSDKSDKRTRIVASNAPRISGISPRSVSADPAEITTVTLTGSGFSASGLSVKFAGMPVGRVKVISDKKISFELPKMREAPGEAPPMVLGAGSHFITVQTKSGTSNPIEIVFQ